MLSIGCDHAGLSLKLAIKAALEADGHAVDDLGTNGTESVDYPDFARRVCDAVVSGRSTFGILVCGSGIGMAMTANRQAGIRAAVLHDTTEARLTRAHNNANVACFGARTVGVETALDALRAFLGTAFEGGRHERRVAKIEAGDA